MTTSLLRRGATLALTVPLVLGLAACSDNSGDKKDSTATVTSTTTTAANHVKGLPDGFDLQAHRGGRGENTEESAQAFRHALELGVTTLEFDIVMSKDGVPVVWHDPEVQAEKCSDTAPATPGDHFYPYVGKLLHQLTWAQLQTLRCDKKLAKFPAQQVAEGNRMLQLKDVFALAKKYGATKDIYYNIETKVEGDHRDWSAEPSVFVNALLSAVEDAGVQDHVMIQSFDWRTFPLVKAAAPNIPLVMLWDETTWMKGSPWTGDVRYEDVNGDILKAAKKLGVQVLSPGYTNPYGLLPGQREYKLVADKEFVQAAHQDGFRVVPWTINNKDILAQQIEAGVDGIITDYPTMLRKVMEDKGMPLPKSFTVKKELKEATKKD